jgi:hypothetical protein
MGGGLFADEADQFVDAMNAIKNKNVCGELITIFF